MRAALRRWLPLCRWHSARATDGEASDAKAQESRSFVTGYKTMVLVEVFGVRSVQGSLFRGAPWVRGALIFRDAQGNTPEVNSGMNLRREQSAGVGEPGACLRPAPSGRGGGRCGQGVQAPEQPGRPRRAAGLGTGLGAQPGPSSSAEAAGTRGRAALGAERRRGAGRAASRLLVGRGFGACLALPASDSRSGGCIPPGLRALRCLRTRHAAVDKVWVGLALAQGPAFLEKSLG